jgi:hypothetical protein
VLGLTLEGIAEAKAKGVMPAGGPGFAYLRGPDDALVEYQGNMPVERFNHVHLFQDQPFCAQLWYRPGSTCHRLHALRQPPELRRDLPRRSFAGKDVSGAHLGRHAPDASGHSTRFGDVSFFWYMNQGETVRRRQRVVT